MSVWLDFDSKVIVQGMTGSEGHKHTQRMVDAGTWVVAGVTPGKGGQSIKFEEDPVPVGSRSLIPPSSWRMPGARGTPG